MTEPGLAPQRTGLAWRRTLLALTVVGLLGLRLAVHYGTDAASMLAAAAGMLLWLGAMVVAFYRGRAVAASRPAAAGRALPLCAAACVGYAVIGAILVLTHLPR
jgi:uncharacterized membrane protein YidH (DUF202 family)